MYVPHAGCIVQNFDDTIDQLRYVLQQGRNLKRRLVVGGDFNSQVNVGIRGAALESLSNAFGLNITNDGINEWENDWTFRSSTGVKRKIDFILASRSLVVRDSIATNEIDMGSDHRAVKARFDIGENVYWEKVGGLA